MEAMGDEGRPPGIGYEVCPCYSATAAMQKLVQRYGMLRLRISKHAYM